MLRILRTAPEVRYAANIETRDGPIGMDYDLALSEGKPQCPHETQALPGMS